MVLAIDQGAQPRHASFLEARRQRAEQRGAYALQPGPGVDLDREYPAGRRLAELPGPHLAGNKACQGSAIAFRHQEMALRGQHILPVGWFGKAGQPLVQSGNRRQIRDLSGADRNHI